MAPRTLAVIPRSLLFLATAVALSVPQFAFGDVTFVGSVNPDPPSAGGTFPAGSELIVGDENDTNNADFRAYLSVDDGTLLQYGQLIVGDDENFLGIVNVTGNFLQGVNTQFNFTGIGSTGNPSVQIGNEGFGQLTIAGGAQMNVSNLSGNMALGLETTGVGHMKVIGDFTAVTVQDNIAVGQEGIGTLEILEGARVQTVDSGALRFVGIGTTATGVGTLVIDGEHSVLLPASNLVVGATIAGAPTTHGQGTLRISNGGSAIVTNISTATTSVGRLGRVELSGGMLVGNTPLTGFGTTVNGYLGGDGLVRGSAFFSAEALVEANAAQRLRFDGNVSNQGSISINHGEVEFRAGFTNNAAAGVTPLGRISLEEGTVRFMQPLTNQGVISSAEGENNIHGQITNEGRVVVASDTVATFFDPFTNSTGVITVLPRGNALFLSNLSFLSLGALSLEVGVENMTDVSSQINAYGTIALGGNLTVEISGVTAPTLGQRFELMSAEGGISGAFDSAMLPDIPGALEWGLVYGATSLALEARLESATVGLAGDYNDDGIVNAADYSVWRNAMGQSITLPNDETPGEVTSADYLVWKQHYGETLLGSGGLANSPLGVPEPGALALLALAGVTLSFAFGRAPRSRS